MDNIESILDELNDYEKRKTDEIPKALEEYLAYLAKTGDTLFLWPKIKWLVRHKLELVISLFRESCPTENLPPCPNVEPFHYETMRDKILEQFDSFTCAPFTIQRLCELLCSPRKHYKRTDKFMRGIEKNLLVVSTVDPEKRKSLSSSQSIVNGVLEESNAVHHGVTNNTRTVPWTNKDGDRPESAASDVASASDADSGISDTEDEEKPAKKQPQETEQSSDTTDPEAAETKVEDSESPPEPVPAAEKLTEAESKEEIESQTSSDEVAVETSESNAMEEQSVVEAPPACEKAASLEEQIVSAGVGDSPATEEPAAESVAEAEPKVEEELKEEVRESAASDKKRPLEVDEDDENDAEHSPDAKQPRIFSPDKPVESLPEAPETSPAEEPAVKESATESSAETEASRDVVSPPSDEPPSKSSEAPETEAVNEDVKDPCKTEEAEDSPKVDTLVAEEPPTMSEVDECKAEEKEGSVAQE